MFILSKGQLFISYRRQDAAGFVATFFQALSSKLGKHNVIFDRVSIPIGVDFRDYLSRRIRDCDIVIMVIGPTWKDAQKGGQRRLDQNDDPVLAELEVAIQSNKHVMPVLIHAAEMPVEADLPLSLKTLAYKNAFRFGSDASFGADLKKFLEAIQDYRLPKKRIRRLTLALTGFILLSVGLTVATGWLLLAVSRANSVGGTKANLRRFDQQIFSGTSDETVEIARAFPNRDALDKATSIKERILATRQSFDLFVFSGKALAESETAMIEAVERGVRLRIILVDQSPKNQNNVLSYLSMLDQSGRSPKWYRDNFSSTIGILQRVEEGLSRNPRVKGQFEVRAHAGPFSNSFWVCDAGVRDGECAHIAVSLYGDDRKFPAIRFGGLSHEVVENLASQFEYLWNRSGDIPVDQ